MYTIDMSTDEQHFSVDANLSGVVYTLDADYNDRSGTWFLSLYLPTADARVPVSTSMPAVVGLPLLLGVYENAPAGQLVVIGDRDPGRDDWGTHAKLVYMEPGDL